MTNKDKKDGIAVGMVIAAAIVVWCDNTLAEEILNSAGMRSIADMRKVGCDDYDINKLRDVIKDMQRRKKLLQKRIDHRNNLCN